MTDVTIRPSRPEDTGALAQIFHDAVQIGSASVYTQAQRDDWSQAWPTAEVWAKRLDGLTTLVAEIDATPQGFISLRDGDGHLDLLFVTPRQIGKGLGYRLYTAILDHARRIGLHRLTVEASTQSEVLFRRQGWHQTGHTWHGEGEAKVQTTLMAFDISQDHTAARDETRAK